MQQITHCSSGDLISILDCSSCVHISNCAWDICSHMSHSLKMEVAAYTSRYCFLISVRAWDVK